MSFATCCIPEPLSKNEILDDLKDDLKKLRIHLKDIKKLSLPISLKHIAIYHKYWRNYHCYWDYEDYSEDFAFDIFLNKLKHGYKKKEINKLEKEEEEQLNKVKNLKKS